MRSASIIAPPSTSLTLNSRSASSLRIFQAYGCNSLTECNTMGAGADGCSNDDGLQVCCCSGEQCNMPASTQPYPPVTVGPMNCPSALHTRTSSASTRTTSRTSTTTSTTRTSTRRTTTTATSLASRSHQITDSSCQAGWIPSVSQSGKCFYIDVGRQVRNL